MKGLDNSTYVMLLVISNLVAVLQVIAAVKWPRIARWSFFLLFSWASYTNWTESQRHPEFYLEYGDLTWSRLYSDFINGWFSRHIRWCVGLIATSQALMAISILLKGWWYRAGSIAAIIFLVSILPLGVGSGFPCTGIMSVALVILLQRKEINYLWLKKTNTAKSRTGS